MSNFTDVVDFNKKMEVPGYKHYLDIPLKDWELAIKLIKEEYREFLEEVEFSGETIPLSQIVPENVIKECADILYVVHGIFYRMGIDADAVFKKVHEANLTKLGDDGKPVRREDGKIIKSENYVPCDLSDFVLAQNLGVNSIDELTPAKTEDFGTADGFDKLASQYKPKLLKRIVIAVKYIFTGK